MKKQKIKNKFYREFLDTGLIQFVNPSMIEEALKNASECNYRDNKTAREARALIIALYFTGARPNEILRIRAKHVEKDRRSMVILVPGSKKGLTRKIRLPLKNTLVKELYKYATNLYPEFYLFMNFRSKHFRRIKNKRGEDKTYFETTDSLRHWFNKWFKDMPISPYYLRHNRISKLMEKGISLEGARILKGSKTYASIFPYIHMSKKELDKISRMME